MTEHARSVREGTNEAMLDRLRVIVTAADPVPVDLRRIAGQLLIWRTVDADLAELLGDGVAPAPSTAD